MEILNHALGCGLGCLGAHFIRWFFRSRVSKSETFHVEQSQYGVKPARVKAYTVGGKMKPRMHTDKEAFLRENDL